jgi:hypothetical protein
VRVIDDIGLVSSNQAEVVITVNAASPISLAPGAGNQAPVVAQAGPPSNAAQFQPGPAAVPTVRVAEVGTAVAPRLPAQPTVPPTPRPTSTQRPMPLPTAVREVRIAGLRAAQANSADGATTFTATVQRGSNVNFEWSFGDGAVGSGATVAHRYAAVGRYTVVLTATNSQDRAVTTLRIAINSLPPTPTLTPTPTPTPTPEPTPLPVPTLESTSTPTPTAAEPLPTALPAATPQGGGELGRSDAASPSAYAVQWMPMLPNQATLLRAKEQRAAEAIVQAQIARQRKQIGVFMLTFVALTQVVRMARWGRRRRRASGV